MTTIDQLHALAAHLAEHPDLPPPLSIYLGSTLAPRLVVKPDDLPAWEATLGYLARPTFTVTAGYVHRKVLGAVTGHHCELVAVRHHAGWDETVMAAQAWADAEAGVTA